MTRSAASEEPGGHSARSASPADAHPLPLNIDFMLGRGFLWAEDVRVSDWLTVDRLRMEIPDLSFPFDAGGGVDRFQNTRCLVREAALSIDESGFQARLRRVARHIDSVDDITVRFADGDIRVHLKLDNFGRRAHLSLRAALLPPEPPRGDELHLSLYDYRAFGPLPYPARLLAFEVLTGALDTPTFSPAGASGGGAGPFQIGVAGDILSLRPFKLLLLSLFPRQGWKLPGMADVELDDVRIEDGTVFLRASGSDQRWRTEGEPAEHLYRSPQGRRALAAYEAKDLFAPADEALFQGALDVALRRLEAYRADYDRHPDLMARTLECLLADPTGPHLEEARAICRELESDDPDDLRAALARPTIALIEAGPSEEGRTAALEAYDRLGELLEARGDADDRALALIQAADMLADRDPAAAARRLERATREQGGAQPGGQTSAHRRAILERLRELYEQLGENDRREQVLKRLAALYDEPGQLRDVYMELARHLIHREGELGEARHWLQKALKIDDEDPDALEALGESYALADRPLRAVKAFAAAARAAESTGDTRRAADLQGRVARLWAETLDEPEQALLSARRAVALSDENAAISTAERTRYLAMAARLCDRLDRQDGAIGYWTDVIEAVGDSAGTGSEPLRARLREAHERLGSLYEQRGRRQTAAGHWERLLHFDPSDHEAADRLADHYRRSGQPRQLADLLEDQLALAVDDERERDLRRQLARLYDAIDRPERAQMQRRALRDLQPPEAASGLGGAISEFDNRDNREKAGSHRETREHQDPQDQQDDAPPPEAAWVHRAETQQIESLDDASRRPKDQSKERSDEQPEEPSKDRETASEDSKRHSERLADSFTPGLVAKSSAEDASETGDSDSEVNDFGDSDFDEEDFATEEELRASIDELLGGATGSSESSELDEPEPQKTSALPAPSELEPVSEPISEPISEPKEAGEQDETEDETGDESPAPENKSPRLSDFRHEYRRLMGVREEDSQPRSERNTRAALPWEVSDRLPEPDLPERESRADSDSEVPELQTSTSPGDFGPSTFRTPDEEPEEEPEAREAQPEEQPEPPDIARLEALRNEDDDATLADALAEAVERWEAGARGDIERATYLQWLRELGELLYLELEDGDRALTYLERLLDEDPDGLGRDTTVLRVMEAIYEARGDIEGRIDVLRARLEAAEETELEHTFRTLLAQLFWEEKDAPERARQHLEAVMEETPDHEGAHRLAARIARSQDHWEAAAVHLQTVLEVAGDGLDALENRRDLAGLLLEKLDRPEEAADHFARVLEDAPGDTRALDGLKACQRATESWEGYVETLGRELGLIVGEAQGLSPEEMLQLEADELREAAGGMHIQASQLLHEAAEVMAERLARPEHAQTLAGLAARIWSDNIDALDLRIGLDRILFDQEALADDLIAYAEGLLDPAARFEALVEAAQIHRDEFEQPERARELFEAAVDAGETAENELGRAPSELHEARSYLSDQDTDES